MRRNNRMLPALALVMVASLLISQPAVAQEVPTETPTPEATATLVPTQTETPTLTETALPTLPPTPLPTETPTESYTPSLEPTTAFTPTATTEATNPAATPTATFTPEPPLALIVNESFDGTLSPLWNVGAGWMLTPNENGQALSATNLDTSVALTADTLNDVVVQLRTQFTGGLLRLNLRESAAGAYTLTLDTAGQLKLYRTNVEIASALVAPMGSSWRTIRLSAIGGIIRVAVDGADMLAIYDQTPLTAGGFSLTPIGLGQATLMLDDVSFWVPDVTNPQATPTTGATETLAPSATVLTTETATSLPTETQLPTATATLEAEPPLNLLMTDNFDTGALYFWTVSEGWTLTPNNTGLAMQAVATAAPFSFVHSTLTDVAVEARVKQTNSAVRLSLRESAVGAYVLTITPDGQVTLARGTTVLATSQVTHWTTDTWRTIRLSAVGSVIRVAIDTVPLMAIRDENPLPMGGFAFSGSVEAGATLLIDDVSLWIAGEIPATVTPTATATTIPNIGDYVAEQVFYQDFDQGGDPLAGLTGPFWRIYGVTAENIALYMDIDDAATSITNAQLGNVSLAVRVRLNQGIVRLHLRQQVDTGYVATLSSSGQLALYRNDVLIATPTSLSSFINDGWNDFQISAYESSISITLNGMQVLNYSDPAPLLPGLSQISATDLNGSYALIDNIEFSQLVPSHPDDSLAMSAVNSFNATDSSASMMSLGSPMLSSSSATIANNEVWTESSYSLDQFRMFQIVRDGQVATYEAVDTQTGYAGKFTSARLSHDGSKILFTCPSPAGHYYPEYDPAAPAICVMNSQDQTWYAIEYTQGAYRFDWSPDGRQIVFSRFQASGPTGLYDHHNYTINLDGSGLVDLQIDGYNPRWVEYELESYIFYVKYHYESLTSTDTIRRRSLLDGTDAPIVYETYGTNLGGLGAFDIQEDTNGHLKLAYSRSFYVPVNLNGIGDALTRGIRVHDLTTGQVWEHYDRSAAFEPGQTLTTLLDYPVLAPDGHRVAYTTFPTGYYSISNATRYVIAIDNLFSLDFNPGVVFDTGTGPSGYYTPQHNIDWLKLDLPIPIEGMIVYSAEDANGISQIYGMVGNTGIIQQLTATTSDATSPALAPDGRTLAFVVNGAVHTKDITRGIGSPMIPVSSGDTTTKEPVWASNGALYMIASGSRDMPLYGGSGQTPYTELIRIRLNGSNRRTLIADASMISDLHASRSGSRLAFSMSVGSNGGSDIYILDMEQSNTVLRSVTNDGATGVKNRQPALSPDGNRVAFSQRLVGAGNADIVEKQGVTPNDMNIIVSNASTEDSAADYASDGNRLAYIAVDATRSKIVIVEKSQTGFVPLAQVTPPNLQSSSDLSWLVLGVCSTQPALSGINIRSTPNLNGSVTGLVVGQGETRPVYGQYRGADGLFYLINEQPSQWISDQVADLDMTNPACLYLQYRNEDGSEFALSIEKTIDSSIPVVGQPVNYTVTISNSSSEAFTAIKIEDELPAGFNVSASGITPAPTGGSTPGTGAERQIVWDGQQINAQSSLVITIPGTFAATASGQMITNTASFSINQNPVATDGVTVIPATCLQDATQALTIYQTRAVDSGQVVANVETGSEIGIVGTFIDDPTWVRVVIVDETDIKIGWTNGIPTDARCTDTFVDADGQVILIPDYNPTTECLAVLNAQGGAYDFYVYSRFEIADKTNRLDGIDISDTNRLQLENEKYIVISAIHPNRQYVRVRYYDEQGVLQRDEDDRWIQVRNSSDLAQYFGVTLLADDTSIPCSYGNGIFNSTRVDRLILPDDILPACRTTTDANGRIEYSQFLNCKPIVTCDSVFGCEAPNLPNGTDSLILSEFDNTDDGCDNNCEPEACPSWPLMDDRHCGQDLVTRGDAEYDDQTQRMVYTVDGGILREYSEDGDRTFKFRGRSSDGTHLHPGQLLRIPIPGEPTHVFAPGETPSSIANLYGITLDALLSTNTVIVEYQYTHVQDDNPGIVAGEYIAAGTWIGTYTGTPNSGSVALHVHVTIKYFYEFDYGRGSFTESTTQFNDRDPRRDDRYGNPNMPGEFYVPFLDRPALRTNQANTDIGSVPFRASPRGVTYTYSSENLPPGLILDNSTGFVTGTPTTPGEYQVVIIATDNREVPRTGRIRFTWIINP